MEKEQRKKLVVQLSEKIKISRALINYREEKGFPTTTHPINEEFFCSKHITHEKYSDLVILYDMLMEYNTLDKQKLTQILSSRPITFAFLRELNRHYEDFASLLRKHGPKWIVVTYCRDRRFKDICRTI